MWGTPVEDEEVRELLLQIIIHGILEGLHIPQGCSGPTLGMM